VLAVKTSICRPMVEAAACACAVTNAALRGTLGLMSTAKRVAAGNRALNSPSRFAVSSVVMEVTPVTLPPGRLKLVTMPVWTGSAPVWKTIGMLVLAAFAAGTPTAPPLAKITVDPPLNQLCSHRRQSIVLIPRIAELDRNVPAVGEAHFAQPLAECRLAVRVSLTP
jgi:hypothetical protein